MCPCAHQAVRKLPSGCGPLNHTCNPLEVLISCTASSAAGNSSRIARTQYTCASDPSRTPVAATLPEIANVRRLGCRIPSAARSVLASKKPFFISFNRRFCRLYRRALVKSSRIDAQRASTAIFACSNHFINSCWAAAVKYHA